MKVIVQQTAEHNPLIVGIDEAFGTGVEAILESNQRPQQKLQLLITGLAARRRDILERFITEAGLDKTHGSAWYYCGWDHIVTPSDLAAEHYCAMIKTIIDQELQRTET